MPDTIRRSGGFARPWRGGFSIAVGALLPLPARAAEQPKIVLHEIVVDATRSIDSHQVAVLVLLVGLLTFAVVTAIMLLRTRARLSRLETSSHDEVAALRADIDRANALLLSEPQVMVDWPAASDEPSIEGDPEIVGASAPHRVLAFGSWLDPARAAAMEQAVDALRTRGEAFAMAFTTLGGRPIEAQGRAIAGRAVLRLKDAAASNANCSILPAVTRRCCREVASLRALVEKLPSPVWMRDAAGRLSFVNAAYARAVEATGAADAIERDLELLDSSSRQSIARALGASGAYSGRFPRSSPVRGGASTYSIFAPTPAVPASASTRRKPRRCERACPHDRRTPPHARCAFDRRRHVRRRQKTDLPQRRLRGAVEPRCRLPRKAARRMAVLEELRAARKLPEEQDFRQWKTQLHAAYRALEAREHTWHLPDGRSCASSPPPILTAA